MSVILALRKPSVKTNIFLQLPAIMMADIRLSYHLVEIPLTLASLMLLLTAVFFRSNVSLFNYPHSAMITISLYRITLVKVI